MKKEMTIRVSPKLLASPSHKSTKAIEPEIPMTPPVYHHCCAEA